MFRQSCTLAFAAGALFLSAAPLANAGESLSDNKVVLDTNNNIVRSIEHGTCVRTQWEAGTNICAPIPPAPVVAAPPPPKVVQRTVLSKEEKTVYFAFDSAELTDSAKQQLDGVATTLSGAKDVESADIVGFADRKGANSYNVKLSEKRAENVKNYLAERGYVKTQLAAVRGLGESSPSTTCDPSLPRAEEIACLAPDRRVEVELKYSETVTTTQ